MYISVHAYCMIHEWYSILKCIPLEKEREREREVNELRGLDTYSDKCQYSIDELAEEAPALSRRLLIELTELYDIHGCLCCQ